MKKPNENDAIQSFLDVFSQLTGISYSIDDAPDDRGSYIPEVDWVLSEKYKQGHRLAVEHTIIESFEGQLRYANRSYDLVQEIDYSCRGRLPSDRYFALTIPHTLLDSLWKQNRKHLAQDLAKWTVSVAGSLKVGDRATYAVDGYRIVLFCQGSNPSRNGTVGRLQQGPPNEELLRLTRLWYSMIHGMRKFLKYRRPGWQTVLLLEDLPGTFDSGSFLKNLKDFGKRLLIRILVDYAIVFDSDGQKMITASIWKEKRFWHEDVPFDRRFDREDGCWKRGE